MEPYENVVQEKELNIKPSIRILYEVKKLPFFTLLLSSSLVVCYFVDDENIFNNLCYSTKKENEPWRLISYTFLHSDLYHLLGNVSVLLITAIPLEIDLGFWKAALIYFSGQIAGAVGFNMIERKELLIGASSGCSCMVLAHIVLSVRRIKWERSRSIKIEKDFHGYHLLVLACLAISDITCSLLSLITSITIFSHSWSSHLTASLNGLVIGTILMKTDVTENMMNLTKYIMHCIYVLVIIICIINYEPWLRINAISLRANNS